MADKLPGFFNAWYIDQNYDLVLIIPDPRGSTRLVASQPYDIHKISSKTISGKTYDVIKGELEDCQTKVLQIFLTKDSSFFLQPQHLQLDNSRIHPAVKSLCLERPKKGGSSWVGYTSHEANVGGNISKFLFGILFFVLFA